MVGADRVFSNALVDPQALSALATTRATNATKSFRFSVISSCSFRLDEGASDKHKINVAYLANNAPRQHAGKLPRAIDGDRRQAKSRSKVGLMERYM
jgi:hypothetical protein